ncbi:MAG: addiction module toxin RelE [Ruminococcaceae bacterium]|nr:addiction module toxin RelE [Oscillospiraceae bacterium]MBQ8897232.1 type II toxin-antitoxin system RelE/ParE family toxin [Clostridia bacterium]
MTRTFVELPLFRAKWKSLGLTDDDLKRLQEEILLDPKTGAVIRETGGIRKMRFAFEHRGKSGSIRVIYVDFEVYEKIYLLTAYPKNEKDNLTKSERNELRELVKVLENQLRDSNEEE